MIYHSQQAENRLLELRPNTVILFYSILFYSILFYSILFYSFLFYSIVFHCILLYSILFYSILFYSILFYSILFYSIIFYFIPFYSILFCSILFCSILFAVLPYVTVSYLVPTAIGGFPIISDTNSVFGKPQRFRDLHPVWTISMLELETLKSEPEITEFRGLETLCNSSTMGMFPRYRVSEGLLLCYGRYVVDEADGVREDVCP